MTEVKPACTISASAPLDGPSIAIECVRAVDPALEELWNIGPARGP